MALLIDLHSANRGANELSTEPAYQDSVSSLCQGLSEPMVIEQQSSTLYR